MFSCDIKYVEHRYIQSNVPVQVDGALRKEIELKAKKVLALTRNGEKNFLQILIELN
jgi:hypothetical protein